MRFVGEMIRAGNKDIIRNDLYAQTKVYGLNTEKAKWIAGFFDRSGFAGRTTILVLESYPSRQCVYKGIALS